ncbi:AMP-dependent synthetase/ligase [Pseudonocardia bannensis]|uniref:Long-chain fatty acid--CoA ligase n=1 Tax=Pseudonocardia bannensis TaxID=630973 RepID=A0A848DN51_9PSEU|nr:long-chain fatty acid--CoA ligase [Pseudonocardia bannensis]NMH93975.1 long-chain fatty acid--CoA ligase [Pseudonocardia bannensis]
MSRPTTQHLNPPTGAGAATIAGMFLDRVAGGANDEAFRFPAADGSWESVTWRATGERVTKLAAGLLALGIAPGERVAIVSGTRYEWILADLAVMCAGAATTTVYPSTIADDVAYILSDSDSRVVIAEDPTQLAKLRERRAELPAVHTVVLVEGGPGTGDDGDDGWVIGLDELARRGAELLAATPDAVTARIASIAPDDLATLIYTSGTTGRSKGVRLTHAAWAYQGGTLASERILRPDDLQYLWLPLAHAFGKVLLTAQLAIGFATAVDGRVDRIVDNLAVVRPTFMGAAPRIFEKAHAKIVTTVAAEGGVKAKLFDWALSVGMKVSEATLAGRPVPPLLALAHRVADALVLRKIRDRFGGRIRFFVSGSAALAPDLARWFHAAGVLILEGYGMTECAAGASVNRPDSYRLGTVGHPLPGTEIRIAPDGEVLMRSPSVMSGYHQLPEATAGALDDGWLATGDIGEIDADGFLRITDRKKDLFKTSGGKYVAPQPIEGKLLALCPYVSQVIVHGSGRNFCSALIALDPDAIRSWAAGQGLGDRPYAEIIGSPAVRDLVQGYLDQLNTQVNRWESIKKFVLLERELTIEDGELTPSLKIRRKKVEDAHRDRLDALYTS